MDSEERLAQRVEHIKRALAEITSSLVEERPARAYTSVGFRDLDDLNSSRSQDMHDLRRQLDLSEGRNHRLEEKLRATEQTYREMSSLMEELYRTVEELQEQKRAALKQVSALRDLESHYESQRKQIAALQAALTQKERQLASAEAERQQWPLDRGKRTDGDSAALGCEVQRLMRENEQLAEDFHRASQENIRLSSELRKSLHTDSDLSLRQTNSRLQQELDTLTRQLKVKDEEVRELNEKVYEKHLVAEAYKRPSERPQLVNALCRLLGERSPDELVAAVESLLAAQKRTTSATVLVDKLGRLIQDCAPVDANPGSVSTKQIWRWVRRLVEEYMGLKGQNAEMERRIAAIAKRLGVSSLSDVEEAVTSVIQERNSLKNLEGKVKALVSDSDPIKILD